MSIDNRSDLRPAQLAEAANAARRRCGEPSGAPAPEGAAGTAAHTDARARHVAGAKDILALTLWGEAAGLPVRALEAVASVVMNRVRIAARPDGPAHLGVGVIGVCRAPFQFACWHPGHPRHRSLAESLDDPALDACHRIAARAIAGALPDLTHGATHYHAETTLPGWALGRASTVGIAGLVFYRLVG